MKARIFAGMFFLILSVALAAGGQDVQDLLQRGDALFELRGDLSKAREALQAYQSALAKGEEAYGACWRMARVEYWIGDHTAGKGEKKRIFEMGIYHAKRAVQADPGGPEGHYWLGVLYGVYGEAKGVLKSLSLVKPIKAEMNAVLAVDPAFDAGGPDRVLGRVFHELPGFAGGSKEKALEHLLKSKEFGPQVGLTRIYLADTYLALGQVLNAREELEFVLAMEPDPKLIPETAEEKEMARARLAKKEFSKKR